MTKIYCRCYLITPIVEDVVVVSLNKFPLTVLLWQWWARLGKVVFQNFENWETNGTHFSLSLVSALGTGMSCDIYKEHLVYWVKPGGLGGQDCFPCSILKIEKQMVSHWSKLTLIPFLIWRTFNHSRRWKMIKEF